MFDAPWHWVVLALVALILFFGWKQLPDMARSLGRSLRIFKTEIKGMGEDDKARKTHDDAQAAAPKALPAAEVVRRDIQTPTAAAPAADRPRPRPAPRA